MTGFRIDTKHRNNTNSKSTLTTELIQTANPLPVCVGDSVSAGRKKGIRRFEEELGIMVTNGTKDMINPWCIKSLSSYRSYTERKKHLVYGSVNKPIFLTPTVNREFLCVFPLPDSTYLLNNSLIVNSPNTCS